LPSPCELLLHDIFLELYLEAITSIPEIQQPLNKQLEKIKADPVRSGAMMRDIPLAILQGKIFRVWVGGRKGFRLIYFYDSACDVALPIFVSTEPREYFDYERMPWREMADEIYQDFVEGNDKKFKEVTSFLK